MQSMMSVGDVGWEQSITVVNVRDGWVGVTYVGRGKQSKLGNPFVIGKDGDRDEVIAKYRAWLWVEIQKRGEVWNELVALAQRVKAGEQLQLGCWCAPQACHADVIAKCIDWMLRSQKV